VYLSERPMVLVVRYKREAMGSKRHDGEVVRKRSQSSSIRIEEGPCVGHPDGQTIAGPLRIGHGGR